MLLAAAFFWSLLIWFNSWLDIFLNEINLVLSSFIWTIFWTLGYDTIYGFQDIKDDEIIGQNQPQ